MKHIWLLLQLSCIGMVQAVWNRMEKKADIRSLDVILNLTSDLVLDTDERIRTIEVVRLNNFRTASFEIGFLGYQIVEEYRRMIDKYNTTIQMGGRLYPMEVVLYLEEIESHFWHIKHLCNMQHEIERKYRVVGGFSGKPDLVLSTPARAHDGEKRTRPLKDRETRLSEQWLSRLEWGTTKKKSTRWWWPIDYGWEIEKFW